MEEKTWIDYTIAIGSISTPILVLILSAIGWKVRNSIERKIELENKLREDRIRIYNQILEPFIIFLMTDAAWQSDKRHKNLDKFEFGKAKLLSLEYREASFRLALMAPDPLVLSYNNLMQHFYNSADAADNRNFQGPQMMLELLGKFLIEIRKSMGNESTKLDHWAMCEFWMSEARDLKNGNSRTSGE